MLSFGNYNVLSLYDIVTFVTGRDNYNRLGVAALLSPEEENDQSVS